MGYGRIHKYKRQLKALEAQIASAPAPPSTNPPEECEKCKHLQAEVERLRDMLKEANKKKYTKSKKDDE